MEINGIPKKEVLKFLEKKSVKKSKYVVITFLDTFTESGEIFPVGTIFSTKYLKKIKQEIENSVTMPIIGLEYTEGFPDCPGGQFYSESF